MDNPKYIQVMRQVASDFDGISHELFQVASDLERMDQYNPQQKLFSLVRSAEVSSVTLRNLTARTVRDDTAPFYCEVADLLGIKVEETHDWLKISVPAILPKRNQRDNQAFLTRPLRYAIMDYLKENPMERFGAPSALFTTMMLLLEKGAFVTMTTLKPSGIWMSLNRCY